MPDKLTRIEITTEEYAAALAEIEQAEPVADWDSESVQAAVQLAFGIVDLR